jgi:hypothetical protein
LNELSEAINGREGRAGGHLQNAKRRRATASLSCVKESVVQCS